MPKAAPVTDTAPAFELVVIENFDGRTKGDVIADADQIKALLDSEWAAHCVKRQPSA